MLSFQKSNQPLINRMQQRRHLVDVNQAIADYDAGVETIIDKNSYKQLQLARDLCHEVLGADGDKPSE